MAGCSDENDPFPGGDSGPESTTGSATVTLPHPSSPLAPKYWRDEMSGVLDTAVQNYLRDPRKLSLRDTVFMRAYVRQWIMSPVWDMNPSHDQRSRDELARLRRTVGLITDGRSMQRWLSEALDAGIDPL